MYNKWKCGDKSIIAIREARNDSWMTNKLSGIYYWLVQKLVIADMPKGGFDTYMLDRSVVNRIVEINDRNSPITLQILWMGFGPEKVYYERKSEKSGSPVGLFQRN